MKPTLRILGTRGVPAAHGGFETFAEALALHLERAGWEVVVYCQEQGAGPITEDVWRGLRRVRIPVAVKGPVGTVLFDWRAIAHACRFDDLCLTLGYNTAVFCARMRLAGLTNVINMDGIEWQRAKWGPAPRLWFRFNEWAGRKLGNHLVADHPAIAEHLARGGPIPAMSIIPYGADALQDVPTAPLAAWGLQPGRYLTVIARAEPENSVLEVVSAYSRRPRGMPLVVLGHYDRAHDYQRVVLAAAGGEVKFLGAVYDKASVQSLRFHSLAYVHGHQVGGTNPSLVEALGAGNPVIAHDNRFNRWVAGDQQRYFAGADQAAAIFDGLLDDVAALRAMAAAARARHHEAFTWQAVLEAYEALLASCQPRRAAG